MQTPNDNYISNKIAVPLGFKEVFSHFYAARNTGDNPIEKTFFPSYQTMLVFSFGEVSFTSPSQQKTIPIEKCLVLGPVKKAFDYRLGDHTEMFVINFKGEGFHRFFSRAMAADFQTIHPDELVEDHFFSRIWHQLKEMDSDNQRAQHILTFCRNYLDQQDETIQQILAQSSDPAVDPIKTVAENTNQTQRNVQRKHKKHLGYSAKAYARYERFKKTITFIHKQPESASGPVDWFDVIEQNGYYDQSHLIKDFKYFLDLTPSQYMTLHQDICVAHPADKR
jgi:AraC-like DNA-binding protein